MQTDNFSSNCYMSLYKNGFSLIELLVVITIVAILGAVSYPGYKTFRLESRRSDAHATLINVKGILTEYLVLHNKSTLTSNDLANIALPTKSKNGMYSITVNLNGSGYQITATAIDKQTEDLNCNYIILDDQGNRISQNNNRVNSSDCW